MSNKYLHVNFVNHVCIGFIALGDNQHQIQDKVVGHVNTYLEDQLFVKHVFVSNAL